jgi:hypothetical protein
MAKPTQRDDETRQPGTDKTSRVPVEVGMEALHRETVPSMANDLERTEDESTPARERKDTGRD